MQLNRNDISHNALNHSDSSYRSLFDKYYSYVYTIVFQILRSCGTSKDVTDTVEDVFADIFMRLDLDQGADIKSYIGTVARNKAINVRRNLSKGNWQTVSLDDQLYEIPSDSNVEELAENSELADILLDKVEALGEPDSTIILQKYFYNRNSREISAVVGLSPTAVRVRLARALKKLRKLLENCGIEI